MDLMGLLVSLDMILSVPCKEGPHQIFIESRRMKQLLNQVKCRCRRHFGVQNRDCRSPGMGRVVKKGSRALEGVQLILEEGNDLGSRWGWTASQRSDMPRTCQVT